MNRAAGFTLLEVLFAMSIFAVIGLGANQMLRTVIDTHTKTKTQINDFSDLTRAFAVMERDLTQAVPRSVRDEYGDPLPSMLLATGPYLLELTRTGWSNPIGLSRSNLQRVAYELNSDGEVLRHFWLVLDRAEDSEPITQTILSGVEDFRVRMLTEDGDTTNIWPDSDSQLLMPLAAEVFLETSSYGELRKVFDFVEVARAGGPILGQDNNDSSEGDSDRDGDLNTRQGDPDEIEAQSP
jgi:general secretion pathway protein J